MAVWTVFIPSLITSLLCAAGATAGAIRRISVAGSLITLAWSGALAYTIVSLGPAGGSHFYLDALGAYLAVIVSLLALVASLSSYGFMEHEAQAENLGLSSWRVYYGLLHLFTAAMLVVPVANNLGLLWIAVEATTLSSAFLVGFHRHRHSIEAAWKYVILCSVGIAFALFGTILFYYAGSKVGNVQNLSWTTFMQIAPHMDSKLAKLAFLFIVIGYGTKAGLAPMHAWLPDAHSQAPSPVSAMLSGVLLGSAFYALLRFHAIAAGCLGPVFTGQFFFYFGLCSLAIAVPFILVARDYKRMLAYSSVEHMGIMAFGAGIGTPLAIYGVFLHFLCHALAKSTVFLSAGRILNVFGTRKITKVSGVLDIMPETGIPFFAAILALSGLPPFGTFVSELLIISQGFSAGRIKGSVLAAVLLAGVFGALMYHVLRMCFGHVRSTRITHSNVPGSGITLDWMIPMVVLMLPLVVLGVWIPKPLHDWFIQMEHIIRGGANFIHG